MRLVWVNRLHQIGRHNIMHGLVRPTANARIKAGKSHTTLLLAYIVHHDSSVENHMPCVAIYMYDRAFILQRCMRCEVRRDTT